MKRILELQSFLDNNNKLLRKNKNNVTTLHDWKPRHHEAKGTFSARLEIK